MVQTFALTNNDAITCTSLCFVLCHRLLFRSKTKCSDVFSEDSKKKRNDSEENIFTELLAGASTNVGTSHQKPKQSRHASNCMTTIDLGSAVLFEQGLRTFLLVGDKIVCCRVSEEGYVLSMFCQIAPTSDLDTLTYSTLPTLKMTVSLSSVVMSLQESTKSCFWNYRPHFLCLQPGNRASYLPSCTAIKRSLFNKLFSCDASLLDSPVIIFGGQDGQLQFWPVNSFAFGNLGSAKLGAKQTLLPQFLYHLEQGVSAMYAADLPCQEGSSGRGCASVIRGPENCGRNRNEPNSGHCNAVVFVGQCDKVVIASESKSSSDKGETYPVDFTDHAILGPVVCSCLNSTGDTLIHSTGKEVFFTKLSICGGNYASSSPSMLKTTSLQIPNVSAVCCVSKKRKTDGANSRDIVYAVAINGKLLQFPLLELQDGDSTIDCGISPRMAGEKVKNYLSEIEALSIELAKVHATIETEDKILKELNSIIHIACQMSEGAAVSEPSRPEQDQDSLPLTCTFTPTFANLDNSGNSSVTLHCKLVNQGSLPLSSYWSLVIRIQGKEPWLNQITGESSTMGKSVPLKSLTPGSILEMDIPLRNSLFSSFHIVVEADLFCDLNSVLADLRADLGAGNLCRKHIEDVIIPVSRQVLDILHFVTIYQTGSQAPVPSIVPGSKEELSLALCKLDSERQHAAHERGLYEDREANVNQEKTFHASYSATFHVSQDAVSFMKTAIQENLAQNTAMVTTGQAVVLCSILRDSSISNHPIDAECSYIDLLTVNGSRASIQVKLASRGTIEVVLLCSSVHLLCHLHEAVLARLKVSSNEFSFSDFRLSFKNNFASALVLIYNAPCLILI